MPPTTHAPRRRRAIQHAIWWPIVLLALGRFLLLLILARRYGWHHDELYYLAGGRHWDLAYVDHALLTPWTAGALDALVGPSLILLRSIPALIGSAIVVITALLAREMGGDRRAQLVAATCFALDPFFLGANHLFQTVTFDQLAWVLASLALIRLLRSSDPRWWLAVGGTVAFGVLAKPTILLWVLGVAAGILPSPARSLLRSRWLAVAALLVAAAAAPFLWFQLAHDWPFLQFTANMNRHIGGELRAKFILELFVQHGLLAVLVWAPGLFGLLRAPGLRRFQPLAFVFVVPAVLLLLIGGKSYYLAPAFPVLYAAGAIVLTRERSWTRGRLLALTGAMTILLLLGLPAALPLLPARVLAGTPYAALNKDQLEEIGWPQIVRRVEMLAANHPDTVIVTRNYGEAGALDVLADRLPPVVSPHNSYWLWGPGPLRAASRIILVGFDHREARRSFTGCTNTGQLEPRAIVDNDESTAHIEICTSLNGGPQHVWNTLRTYG